MTQRVWHRQKQEAQRGDSQGPAGSPGITPGLSLSPLLSSPLAGQTGRRTSGPHAQVETKATSCLGKDSSPSPLSGSVLPAPHKMGNQGRSWPVTPWAADQGSAFQGTSCDRQQHSRMVRGRVLAISHWGAGTPGRLAAHLPAGLPDRPSGMWPWDTPPGRT